MSGVVCQGKQDVGTGEKDDQIQTSELEVSETTLSDRLSSALLLTPSNKPLEQLESRSCKLDIC